MKALTCEMCGSTELMKDGGVFICQVCGCKYSVEEAKRMMIEGSVDVSGSTVKVDNSAFVERYLQNARRAKSKEDWEEYTYAISHAMETDQFVGSLVERLETDNLLEDTVLVFFIKNVDIC